MTSSTAFAKLFRGADLKVILNSDNEEGVPECTPVWNEAFNCHISLWRQKKRIKDVEVVSLSLDPEYAEVWRCGASIGKNGESDVTQQELVSNNNFFDPKVHLNASGIGQLMLIDGEVSFKLAIDRGACTKSQRVKEGIFTVSCSLAQGTAYGESNFYLTRYFLQVVNEDEERIFYKNEGGKRKFMFCDVELGDSLSKEGSTTQILPEIPVRVALYYESGVMPTRQSPLNVFNSLDELKVNPHDCRPLRIKYRIDEVSKKHDVMKFKIKVFSAPAGDATSVEINKRVTREIQPNQLHSVLGFIKPCFTSPIEVLSKRRGPSVARSKKLVEAPKVHITGCKRAATIPAIRERMQEGPNLVCKELNIDKESEGISSVPHPMGNRGGESVPTLPLMQSLTSECSTASQPLVIEILSAWISKAVSVFDELQWHTVGWRNSDSEGNTNSYRVPIRQCPSCHMYASDEPRCGSFHKSELFNSLCLDGMENRDPKLKRSRFEQSRISMYDSLENRGSPPLPQTQNKGIPNNAIPQLITEMTKKLKEYNLPVSTQIEEPKFSKGHSSSQSYGSEFPLQLGSNDSSIKRHSSIESATFSSEHSAFKAPTCSEHDTPHYLRKLFAEKQTAPSQSFQFWLDQQLELSPDDVDAEKEFVGVYNEVVGNDNSTLIFSSKHLEELEQTPQELEESLKNELDLGNTHAVVKRTPDDTPMSFRKRLLLSSIYLPKP